MFRWMPYAMVRVTLFFTVGILISLLTPLPVSEDFLWIICLVLVGLFGIAYALPVSSISKILRGFFGLAAVGWIGCLTVVLKTETRDPSHLSHRQRSTQYYQARMRNYAEEKQRSWRQEAELLSASDGTRWQPVAGKIYIYFPKGDFEKPFHYGDVLLVKGSPELVEPPTNPHVFDFKKFLANKQIYHQDRTRKSEVRFLENDPSNRVLQWGILARSWAERALSGVVHGDREKATATALVLGVTDGLDNELLQAYASTGALHVLAVSGLHVSIIYWIILLLFKPLDRTQGGRWTLAIGSIVLLWGYALITGLSPSVLRAVTMFTFVALARPWKQGTNIFNTLAASAFCLLLYEPHFILSVGFQLSYVAVFGIVYFQPPLYKLWEPDNRIYDEVWKLSSVSIAAQIATLPIGLLYFHQFPNYFLISNLLVIPISFVVLVLGIAIFPATAISWLADGLGYLLTWTIQIMNYFIFLVEGLPFSLVENIYMDAPQAVVLAIGLVFMSILLMNKHFAFLPLTVVAVITISLLQWIHFVRDVQQSSVIVYDIPGHTGVDLMAHGHARFVADSALHADRQQVRFHILPNRIHQGVTAGGRAQELIPAKGLRLYIFRGESVLQLFEKKPLLPVKADVDCVLISNNAIPSLGLLKGINCKKIIIDSSNSYYLAQQLIKQEYPAGTEIHSVVHRGAISFKIDNGVR